MPLVYTYVEDSTAIQTVGYDVATAELRIVFKDREGYPEYIFGGVGEATSMLFLMAESKGRFYHRYLKRNPKYIIDRAMGSYRLGAIARGVKYRAKQAVGAVTGIRAFRAITRRFKP